MYNPVRHSNVWKTLNVYRFTSIMHMDTHITQHDTSTPTSITIKMAFVIW